MNQKQSIDKSSIQIQQKQIDQIEPQYDQIDIYKIFQTDTLIKFKNNQQKDPTINGFIFILKRRQEQDESFIDDQSDQQDQQSMQISSLKVRSQQSKIKSEYQKEQQQISKIRSQQSKAKQMKQKFMKRMDQKSRIKYKNKNKYGVTPGYNQQQVQKYFQIRSRIKKLDPLYAQILQKEQGYLSNNYQRRQSTQSNYYKFHHSLQILKPIQTIIRYEPQNNERQLIKLKIFSELTNNIQKQHEKQLKYQPESDKEDPYNYDLYEKEEEQIRRRKEQNILIERQKQMECSQQNQQDRFVQYERKNFSALIYSDL